MSDEKILGRRVKMPTYPVLPKEKRLSPSEEVAFELDKEVLEEDSPNFDIQPAMTCPSTGGTADDPFEEDEGNLEGIGCTKCGDPYCEGCDDLDIKVVDIPGPSRKLKGRWPEDFIGKLSPLREEPEDG